MPLYFFYTMVQKSQKWPKTQIKGVLPIGNRKKRDCAWGCARRINTTWENLQIGKHRSVRWAERTPSWFVLFDLQIFLGGVYPRLSPGTTSLPGIHNWSPELCTTSNPVWPICRRHCINNGLFFTKGVRGAPSAVSDGYINLVVTHCLCRKNGNNGFYKAPLP